MTTETAKGVKLEKLAGILRAHEGFQETAYESIKAATGNRVLNTSKVDVYFNLVDGVAHEIRVEGSEYMGLDTPVWRRVATELAITHKIEFVKTQDGGRFRQTNEYKLDSERIADTIQQIVKSQEKLETLFEIEANRILRRYAD